MSQGGIVPGLLRYDENLTKDNLYRNGSVDVPLITVWVRSLYITVPPISLCAIGGLWIFPVILKANHL